MSLKKSIRCPKCGLVACKKHSKEFSDLDERLSYDGTNEEHHFFVEDDVQANKFKKSKRWR